MDELLVVGDEGADGGEGKGAALASWTQKTTRQAWLRTRTKEIETKSAGVEHGHREGAGR
jgi:hypothetical protein